MNPQNQGYWFVLREDQSNVIFSSNNFTIQNPQRYADNSTVVARYVRDARASIETIQQHRQAMVDKVPQSHVMESDDVVEDGARLLSQEARYIVDTGDRQFIQINEAPIVAQESTTEQEEIESKPKDDSNFWDRSKIKLLLTLCLENNFKNTAKDKHLLEDFAAHLGTTPEECNNKYKNLRRTFIRLLKKKRQGKEIKWIHYYICEKVFHECKSLPSSVLEPWDEYKVRNLLNIYIENLSRFRSHDCLQKDVWKDVASQVGTTEYNCYHKFKNLKRAYFNWLQRSRDTGKPVKWPYHQYFERIFYDYNPNLGAWDRTKTRQLMDAYLQMADKFKDPRFQKKDLWREISMIVDQSPQSCDKKFRNLKQTYLKLKMRADSGRSITKWRYYKDFETIYSPYWSTATGRSQEEDYINQLLQFYVDNKEKFQDPRNKKKHLWRLLGPKIGLSSEGCDRKFRNLKQTYIRLADKKKVTGRAIRWPYFSYFEKIFDAPIIPIRRGNRTNIDEIATSEVKRMIKQMQDNKDDDKFERLIGAVQESNSIQKERNRILQALLNRRV